MHALTRIALPCLVFLHLIVGCNDDGTSSQNRPPSVLIASITPSSIYFNETIDFAWQGFDPDGNLSGYYVGLDGEFAFTSDTSASYSGFNMGDSHVFLLFAIDQEGARSDTVLRPFSIYPGPPNVPPEVSIVAGPEDSISASDLATFIWQGSDPDGSLSGYFAGLNGNLTWTTDTTATYSGFNPGSSYSFAVVAKDSANALSDTAEWAFAIYTVPVEITLAVYGEGLIDSDGDGFWSQFNVRWQPVITSGSSIDIRLIAGITPSSGGASELLDSTDLVSCDPGDNDTLAFTLPFMTKDYYDVRIELHGADGTIYEYIPYDSIPSLTGVPLEDVEGFFAWFDDAWTDNAVDSLPSDSADGYYESIELWWDADANPEPGLVKVVVRERNSAGIVTNIWPSYTYEIEGLTNEDAQGFIITAGTTLDRYDYRLELLDADNNLLDVLDYGEDPDITDIPLGSPGGLGAHNAARTIND